MLYLYRKHPKLIFSLVAGNILLTIWCLIFDPVINFDGVIYTTIADLFLNGQYRLAMEYYSWPFYSILIAITSKLLFVSTETAALVFNFLMAVSLTFAFVNIVGLLSKNNKRILIIAAVIILFFPSISKYRSYVIRDFGYLSCYLWSLYFLFLYCSSFKKSHLAAWLIFAALSSLFRFEGIIFVLIAPYFLFLFSGQGVNHRKKILLVFSALIATACIGLLLWYINDKYTDSVEVARQAGMNINSLTDFFYYNIQQRMGGQEFSTFNVVKLLFDNFFDVSFEIVRRLAILYLAFVLYSYAKGLALTDHLQRKIWWIYIGFNFLLLVLFSLTNNFFVSRYTMPTVLTLLILAPFAIDRLWEATSNSKGLTRAKYLVVFFLLALISIEGLDVRTDKRYIKEAGRWVAQNVAKEKKVLSNNRLAIYYSDRGMTTTLDSLYTQGQLELLMKSREAFAADYIIMVGRQINYRQDVLRQTLGYHFGLPIQTFYGKRDRFAFIFQVNKAEVDSETP